MGSYFGLIAGVPGEGNGVIGNLLDVSNGVETLFVVGYETKQEFSDSLEAATRMFQSLMSGIFCCLRFLLR